MELVLKNSERFLEFDTKHFNGYWTMIREDGLWKMDESQIEEIPQSY
jgi:hypothetical protein